jgi:tetratricopeptide (TPR) repeat protein
MRIPRRTVWAFACFICIASHPFRAFATLNEADKETVRLLAYDASIDYDAGRYDKALEKFERAYAAAPVPKLALWLARTNARLGHLVKAMHLCGEAVRLESNALWIGDAQPQAQVEAARFRNELERRVPRLVVRVVGVRPSDVALRIDDDPVPSVLVGVERFVDPGLRRVSGRVARHEVSLEVALVERDIKEVVLDFGDRATQVRLELGRETTRSSSATNEPSTSERREATGRTQRRWGWIAVSVGAAGLAVGGVTGALVGRQHQELRERCPTGACGREYWSELDAYDNLRAISSVAFSVGAVGAATGVTLLLTSPSADRASRVSFLVQPRVLAIRAEF